VTANGGAAVVAALVAEGVQVVFGIPGTHNLELYRALAGSGLRHVTPRHEQGAGYAADGYARTSGRPGVCFTTSGPAVNNVAAAVGTAHADSVPLLVVAPGAPTGLDGADVGELHEMRDSRGSMAGVAERSVRVVTAAEAAAVVRETFARWRTGRTRPVFLEVPVDVLEGPWDGVLPPPVEPVPAPAPPGDDLDRAAALLGAARRPALLVGRGAVGACDAVRALAERLGAPVVTTVGGKGVLGERHPLAVGAAVRLAPAQELLAGADAALVVGTGLGDAELWGWAPRFAGATVRVDVDPEQLTKRHTPTLGLAGDAAAVLAALAARLPAAPAGGAGAARAARARAGCAEAAQADPGPWRALNAALAAALPEDAVVAGDSSQVTYYGTVHHWPVGRPNQLLYPVGYATLGYGLPAAIGAKVALPRASVLALVGDGALLFSVAELVTAVEQRLPLPVVVVDNGGYAEIREGMDARGIERVGVDLLTPDFAALGRAVGAHGVQADGVREVVDAVLAALAADRPTVIAVRSSSLV